MTDEPGKPSKETPPPFKVDELLRTEIPNSSGFDPLKMRIPPPIPVTELVETSTSVMRESHASQLIPPPPIFALLP